MRITRVALVVVLAGIAMPALSVAQVPGVREVTASARSIIPLNTKLRYTTMILLPEGEEILDVVCGDRDFWVISATENIAHVKPAKEGAATNLNLVTKSGAVYSFLLSEGKATYPDLKVYVAADPSMKSGEAKYYSAADVAALRTQLADARAAVTTAEHKTVEDVAAFRQHYPATLHFSYRTPKYERPFFVRSIWNDGDFTYIQSDARELPAVYEVTDGQPSIVDFQVESGTYVIPKVVEHGYLVLGKDKLSFDERP